MDVYFKPSFDHLLKKTMRIMLYKDLKMSYSQDMKNFEQFGNVKAVLRLVQKSVSKVRIHSYEASITYGY